MSNDTQTLPTETPDETVADVVAATTEQPEQPATSEQPETPEKSEPTLPTVPDADDDLRNRAQYAQRLADLLVLANASPEHRDAFDARAMNVAARAMTVKPGNRDRLTHETVLMHFRDDINPETGKGRSQKFHYPTQRAQILMGICGHLAVSTLLTHRTYSYSGSRRQYSVQLWGNEHDITRARLIAAQLDQRVLLDLAKIEFEASVSPGEQTKQKRAYVLDFATRIAEMLGKVVDALPDDTQASISDRKTAADTARDEWVAEQEALLSA